MSDPVFSIEEPFTSEPVAEIPLPNSPLERVIAQIRFPSELSLTTEDAIERFREPMRRRYPAFGKDHQVALLASPTGVIQKEGDELWRFSDLEELWKVTVAKNFVALETTSYESRNDFGERLSEVLEALTVTRPIDIVQRLGVRYINRFVGPSASENLPRMVRPSLIAAMTDVASGDAELRHNITESVVKLPSMQMKIRTASLPPQVTVDPAVTPMEGRTWLLDLDGSTTTALEFDPGAVVELAGKFAERIYRVFRWALSDEALAAFGGDA